LLVVEAGNAANLTSKTGQQDDTIVVGAADGISFDAIVKLLVTRAREAGEIRLLFDLTYPQFGRWLGKASRALELPYVLRPHMLRHGGASEDYHQKRLTIDQIQFRGRWRSIKSVQRYMKAGRLLAQARKLKASHLVASERAIRSLVLLF
jgi:integrase